MSRLGKKPLPLPAKVSLKISDSSVLVKGAKGELTVALPQGIKLSQTETEISVTRNDDTSQQKAFHGLVWALVRNALTGVSEGYKKELELRGVGYRAKVQGKDLNLSLGFSHPVLYPIPADLSITMDGQEKVIVEGIDKQRVGQAAAEIRSFRPPEPYKGKGVRYVGEVVVRKEGKTNK